MEHIKKYFNDIKREDEELHTKGDADFLLIMTVIMTEPDFVVCNDRHLVRFFYRYKNKYLPKKFKTKCYKLAHFLGLIRRSFMNAFTNEDLLRINLNVYHNDELEGFFKSMGRAKCFREAHHQKTYFMRNHELFGDYKRNVFQIYNG